MRRAIVAIGTAVSVLVLSLGVLTVTATSAFAFTNGSCYGSENFTQLLGDATGLATEAPEAAVAVAALECVTGLSGLTGDLTVLGIPLTGGELLYPSEVGLHIPHGRCQPEDDADSIRNPGLAAAETSGGTSSYTTPMIAAACQTGHQIVSCWYVPVGVYKVAECDTVNQLGQHGKTAVLPADVPLSKLFPPTAPTNDPSNPDDTTGLGVYGWEGGDPVTSLPGSFVPNPADLSTYVVSGAQVHIGTHALSYTAATAGYQLHTIQVVAQGGRPFGFWVKATTGSYYSSFTPTLDGAFPVEGERVCNNYGCDWTYVHWRNVASGLHTVSLNWSNDTTAGSYFAIDDVVGLKGGTFPADPPAGPVPTGGVVLGFEDALNLDDTASPFYEDTASEWHRSPDSSTGGWGLTADCATGLACGWQPKTLEVTTNGPTIALSVKIPLSNDWHLCLGNVGCYDWASFGRLPAGTWFTAAWNGLSAGRYQVQFYYGNEPSWTVTTTGVGAVSIDDVSGVAPAGAYPATPVTQGPYTYTPPTTGTGTAPAPTTTVTTIVAAPTPSTLPDTSPAPDPGTSTSTEPGFGFLGSVFSSVTHWLAGEIRTGLNGVIDATRWVGTTITNAIAAMANALADILRSILSVLQTGFASVVSQLLNIGDAIANLPGALGTLAMTLVLPSPATLGTLQTLWTDTTTHAPFSFLVDVMVFVPNTAHGFTDGLSSSDACPTIEVNPAHVNIPGHPNTVAPCVADSSDLALLRGILLVVFSVLIGLAVVKTTQRVINGG